MEGIYMASVKTRAPLYIDIGSISEKLIKYGCKSIGVNQKRSIDFDYMQRVRELLCALFAVGMLIGICAVQCMARPNINQFRMVALTTLLITFDNNNLSNHTYSGNNILSCLALTIRSCGSLYIDKLLKNVINSTKFSNVIVEIPPARY